MSTWSRPVLSSMVQEVGYDQETSELLVTFRNGRTCAYAGVSEDMALQLVNAPSVGNMLNSEIKGRYSFRYVT